MIALPSEPGPTGMLLILVGLAVGAGLGIAAWRRLRAPLAPFGSAAPGVAAVVAVAFASAAGTAPFLAWRVVQDLRYTTAIPHDVAERLAVWESDLDGTVFDRLGEAIPPGDTIFVGTERDVPGNFESLARTLLLPRISVSEPADADWIVTMGLDPRSFGVKLASVRTVRTSYGEDAPPTYLARVAS